MAQGKKVRDLGFKGEKVVHDWVQEKKVQSRERGEDVSIKSNTISMSDSAINSVNSVNNVNNVNSINSVNRLSYFVLPLSLLEQLQSQSRFTVLCRTALCHCPDRFCFSYFFKMVIRWLVVWGITRWSSSLGKREQVSGKTENATNLLFSWPLSFSNREFGIWSNWS